MMHLELLPPGLILILGGILMLFVGRRLRDVLTVLLPLLTLAQVWDVDGTQMVTVPFLAYDLITIRVHPYTHIFATVFSLAALGGGIFAMHARNYKEQSAAYIYAGSAIGVTFSGDLLTFFMFWELMAIASTAVIWSADSESSRAAGMRYALMHFLGGVLLMAGIVAHVYVTNVTVLPTFELHMQDWIWTSSVFLDQERIYGSYEHFLHLQSAGIWLMFIGVLINVAAPPFSAWLTDAYPESSPTGMVFLSAFTTKTAVFVLLTLFAGVEILIYIGLFMVFYGIVMAILENDVRRILAYSIINQVGFMVTGIGMGTQLALDGAAAHAFCHIIYKALLLMSAGSVLQMTGKRKCSELGGLYRTMPLTCICGIVGALAISAFPLTSGFVSKSLISDAAAHEGLEWIWYALAAASAGVFLHAGIKFPWFVFFQKDSGLRPPPPPQNMRVAMTAFALMCIIPGALPQQTLYFMLPDAITYEANTLEHVINQLQLLLFSGLAFFVCLPLLKRTPTITLDFDWFYRRLLKAVLILLEKACSASYTLSMRAMQHGINLLVARIMHLTGPGGIFAETKTVANTTLIVATLLAGYLLLYYNV
jgi:multicomponent Na+:H+ antiporter subunit D